MLKIKNKNKNKNVFLNTFFYGGGDAYISLKHRVLHKIHIKQYPTQQHCAGTVATPIIVSLAFCLHFFCDFLCTWFFSR